MKFKKGNKIINVIPDYGAIKALIEITMSFMFNTFCQMNEFP